MFFVRFLNGIVEECENLDDANALFFELLNSKEIFEYNSDGSENVIKSRKHREIGFIEINNKCVYIKVPFFQPSDKLEIRISKTGESPESLKQKMDVIDEKWY